MLKLVKSTVKKCDFRLRLKPVKVGDNLKTKADCSKQWAQKQKRISLQILFLFMEEC